MRFRGNEKGAGSEGNISDLEREEGYCRIEEGTRSHSHTHMSLALALTLAAQGGTTLPPPRAVQLALLCWLTYVQKGREDVGQK